MNKQGEIYIIDQSSSSGIILAPVSGAARIDDSAWLEFADETVRDPSLTGTQPSALRARWASGNAAVVIDDGRIVSYASILSLYTSLTRDTVSRRYPEARLTPVDVIAFASAWTAPRWRGFGFSTHLHERLRLTHSDHGELFVALCHGMGGSMVLHGLKFELLTCRDAAFLSSLSAWYEAGRWHSRRGGPPSRKFYLPPCAGVRPSEMDSHSWQECTHYWVSDTSAAGSLDDEFRALTGGELAAWRHLLGTVAVESADNLATTPGTRLDTGSSSRADCCR